MNASIPAGDSGNPEALPEMPGTVEIATSNEVQYSVIWLHGLGADGHDFEPIVPYLGLGNGPGVRFVFPHAPVRPVTLNGGMPMRAWYDIRAIDASRDQDEQGIEQSLLLVEQLIARELARGIETDHVVLAGFSQGAALAAHVALRHARPLAGLIMLSGYLLFAERLAAQASPANARLPVFIGHGTQDPVVPFEMGRHCQSVLQAQGYPLVFHQYPVPHSVSEQEIADVGQWIRDRLA